MEGITLHDFILDLLKDCKINNEDLGNRHKITLYVENKDNHILIDKIMVDDKMVVE